MTRIIVISDTHGNFHVLKQIVEKHLEEAYCFLYLGDGANEVDDLKMVYPQLVLHSVAGNCDFFCEHPIVNSIEVCKKTIVFTHGHHYQVKAGLDTVIKCGENMGADILLYGHTHKSFTNFQDGFYIMNPGSPTIPKSEYASYGIIDIDNEVVILKIVKI